MNLLCSAHRAILSIVRENVSAFFTAAVFGFVNIKNRTAGQPRAANLTRSVFCILRIAAARADFTAFHFFRAEAEMLQNIFS